MKQHATFYFLCLALLLTLFSAWLQAQEKVTGAVNQPTATITTVSTGEQNHYCPSDDMFKKYLDENPEARARWEEWEAQYRAAISNPNTRQWINSGATMRTDTEPCLPSGFTAGLLTIPVVFHLVRGSTSPAFLTEQQINEAVTNCNGFLLALNGSGGVNTKIRLRLAERTDANVASNGRTMHTLDEVLAIVNRGTVGAGQISDEQVRLIDYAGYSQQNYLNVWVVDEITGSNGYSTFPNKELNPPHGIVIRRNRINTSTLVHEFGHYLDLWHTFGDAFPGGCENDADCQTTGDLVCDTDPTVCENISVCPLPTCDISQCDNDDGGNNPQSKNLMGYASCRDRFTEGQKLRMRNALKTHQNRRTLLDSRGCVPMNIVDADLRAATATVSCAGNAIVVVTVRNNGNADINTLELNCSIVGQGVGGGVAPLFAVPIVPNTERDITISFSTNGEASAGDEHYLYVELLSVNGSTTPDGYSENNKLCQKISVTASRPPIPTGLTSNVSTDFGSVTPVLLSWDPITINGKQAIYRIHISSSPNSSATNGLCANTTCNSCGITSGSGTPIVNFNTSTFSNGSQFLSNYFWQDGSPNSCGAPTPGTYYWTVRAYIPDDDCYTDASFWTTPQSFTIPGTPTTGSQSSDIITFNCSPTSTVAQPLSNFPIATPITDPAKTLAFTNLIFGKSYTAMPTGSSAANPGFVTGNFLATYPNGLACGATSACASYQHKGLDQGVGGSIGTLSLYAPISGVVTATGGSTGKICIYNADLGATFIFLHCTNIAVAPGDDVVRGTYVGRAGSTGASAAHVHSELRAGHKTAGSCQCSAATADGVYDPRIVVDMLSVTTSTPTPTPALYFPADGATNVAIPVPFSFQQVQNAEYRIEVSTVLEDLTPQNGFGNDIRSCDGAPITLVVTQNTELNNSFLWDLISGCFPPLPNTTYYWIVRAHTNECGTSLYSPVRSFTTAPAAPLTVSPTLMTFAATSGFGAQQTATLSNLTGPFTVTKNGTWISYNISGNNIIVYAAGNTGTLSRQGSITITSGNQTATITVRQSGAGGCTVGTQVGSAVTSSTVWQSVTGLTGGKYILFNVTQGTQYTFSLCSANGGVASYDSEMTILDHLTPTFQYAFNQTGAFGCGDDAKLTWTSPITGQVRVLVNQNHCISNAVATTLRHKTGTGKCDDIIMDAALKLYPNPATKTVNVYFEAPEEPEQVAVNLYNTLGELVYAELVTASFCSSISEIDISTFSSGLYYVSVSSSIGVVTEKLIINK